MKDKSENHEGSGGGGHGGMAGRGVTRPMAEMKHHQGGGEGNGMSDDDRRKMLGIGPPS